MSHILQKPTTIDAAQTYPLWLALHGAYDHAEQVIRLFGKEALTHNAYLLAPQASRPCGDGFCWSFARDAANIKALLTQVRETEPIDESQLALIGFSMGCTMACWVLAQHPQYFTTFTALSMGSAFEPWELDDGGIDLAGMRHSAEHTRTLLAVDQRDPYGSADYFVANRDQLQGLGFQVKTLQPNHGVHDVTDEMKEAFLRHL